MPLDAIEKPISYLAQAQQNPAIADAKARAQQFLEMARGYTVNCPELAEAAAEDLKEIKALYKTIESMRKEAKEPVLKEGRAIDDFFRAPLEFLEQAETILKKAIQQYMDHVAEQKRKAEEEARKQAEAERQRLEAERQAQLEAAKAAGDEEAVAQIESALPAFVPEVVAPVIEEPKLAGISTASNWKARVVDMMALVKAVAEGKADIALLEVNQKALNVRAKELKDKLSIPGVEAYNDVQIRARSN